MSVFVQCMCYVVCDVGGGGCGVYACDAYVCVCVCVFSSITQMETAERLPCSAGYSGCGQTSSLLVSPAAKTDAWGCVPGMSAAALLSCD